MTEFLNGESPNNPVKDTSQEPFCSYNTYYKKFKASKYQEIGSSKMDHEEHPYTAVSAKSPS